MFSSHHQSGRSGLLRKKEPRPWYDRGNVMAGEMALGKVRKRSLWLGREDNTEIPT